MKKFEYYCYIETNNYYFMVSNVLLTHLDETLSFEFPIYTYIYIYIFWVSLTKLVNDV